LRPRFSGKEIAHNHRWTSGLQDNADSGELRAGVLTQRGV
jgi:hypothetical protein